MLSLEAKKNKEMFKSASFLPKKVGRFTLPMIALCLLFIIIGCSENSDKNNASSAKAITEFSLNGFEGTINQTATPKTISVIVPTGTNLTAMVATFTTTGVSVVVDSTVQESGATDNNFTTSPVIYTVVAENSTTQEYEVTVIVATKSIISFSVNGVQGTINENTTPKTIEVSLPTGTNLTALVATFTTTGTSVKIGSTVQESGTTVNNFTDPVVYTVTGADASTQDYTVTVEDEPANKPATAISVSMTPNNSGTSVPTGVFCSKTPSITGSFVVTDPDGGSVVVTQWYDNGVLKLSNTITLPSGVTSGSETVNNASPLRFLTGHVITFRATADGVPSNTASSGPIA